MTITPIQAPYSDRVAGFLRDNKIGANRPFIYRGQTIGATPTELFVDGISGQRIKVPTNATLTAVAYMAAHNVTDGVSVSTGNAISIKNVSGTTSLTGTVGPVFATIPSAGATATVAYTADNTNDALAVTVTGTAAKTIDYEIAIYIVCATSPEQVARSNT